MAALSAASNDCCWHNSIIGPSLASTASAPPQWLRLVRKGNRFTAAISMDGVAWQDLGGQTVPMNTTCKVGLIACAGPGGEPVTVVFDSVSLVP